VRAPYVTLLAILVVLAFGRCPAGAQGLPDLTVDATTLGSSVTYDLLSFSPDGCELQPADLCVRAPGARKLLRFSVFAVNQGTVDLRVGNPLDELDVHLPDGEAKWVYSACHKHYHFQTFARYELRRRGETTPILLGQKRSFCVEDTRVATATSPRKYCCTAECQNIQGVQVGWGDLYPSTLPCQWIDITDDVPPGEHSVPPGEYDLCVFLNTAQLLTESNYDNDSSCTSFTIAAPTKPAPKVRLKSPRGHAKAKVGRLLRVMWQKKVPGTFKFQEVWFSPDDGATWRLLAENLAEKPNAYRWRVPTDAVSERARLRVVVWGRNPPTGGGESLQRGVATSGAFRIVP
jgi:hypothetical protein